MANEYYAVDDNGNSLYWPYLLSTISEYQEGWSTYPQIKDHSLDQIEKLRYAYKISNDKDFVMMLKAENGEVSQHTRSKVFQKDGKLEPSWGLCQIHKPSHPESYDGTPFFTDWRWQVRECLRLYQGGTKFYALDRYKNDLSFRKRINSFFTFN